MLALNQPNVTKRGNIMGIFALVTLVLLWVCFTVYDEQSENRKK